MAASREKSSDGVMLNFGFVFFGLAVSFGMNIEEGFLNRLGFDLDILMVTAIAFVVTGLIAHRSLALIVAVILLTLGANVPPEEAARLGYDPDILVAALFVLITIPYIKKWIHNTGIYRGRPRRW